MKVKTVKAWAVIEDETEMGTYITELESNSEEENFANRDIEICQIFPYKNEAEKYVEWMEKCVVGKNYIVFKVVPCEIRIKGGGK